jgi:hypothetical protein
VEFYRLSAAGGRSTRQCVKSRSAISGGTDALRRAREHGLNTQEVIRVQERAMCALLRRLRLGLVGLAAVVVTGALSAGAAAGGRVPPEAVDASFGEPGSVPQAPTATTDAGFSWTTGHPWTTAAFIALVVLAAIGVVAWGAERVRHRQPPETVASS